MSANPQDTPCLIAESSVADAPYVPLPPSSHLPQSPTSSPIEEFILPSPLLKHTSSAECTRSRHSASLARLALMSSSAIEAAAMVASLEETASVPARSTYFDDDDMDEYEEDQLALELDSELCDRLEAQAAASQLPPPTPLDLNSERSLKRSRSEEEEDDDFTLERVTQTITIPDDAPESSKKIPKIVCPKLKAQTPFFSQDWVQDLMEKGKVREDSPALFDDGYSLPPLSGAAATQLPAASQAKNKGKDSTVGNNGSSSGSSSKAYATAATQTDKQTVKTTRPPTSGSSSSDDDVPLARLLLPSISSAFNRPDDSSETASTPVLTAITNAQEAIAELTGVYQRELDCFRGQIAERDLMIDQLRAKLRKRPGYGRKAMLGDA